MWKRGGRSCALDRAQALLSAKRDSLQSSAAKTRDFRPESSLGGGGSRFLKKAPPPAVGSSHSTVKQSQTQNRPESSSRTPALSRLAQIESRSRLQAGQAPKPAQNITFNFGDSQPAVAQSSETSLQLSAESNSDVGLKGKHFLKKKTSAAMTNSNATHALRSPQGPDVHIRSRSRAADVVVPSVGLQTKLLAVVGGVSLDSDEEDMRKLLGDSMDSSDNSLSLPGRPSSVRAAHTRFRQSSHKVHPTPPPPGPRSPASPPRRSSPFRFTGQAQAHFSPSALSPSSSPPRDSQSPLGRRESPHRSGSPQRPISSMSHHSEVLSLYDLFPVQPSEELHSEMSEMSSEDFKMNVFTLDELEPAQLAFTEETQGRERETKLGSSVSKSPIIHQLPGPTEKEEREHEEADSLNYQSDFETSDDSQTVRRSKDSRSSKSSRSSALRSSSSFSHQSRRRASTGKGLKDAAVQTQPDLLAYTRPTALSTFNPPAFVVNQLLMQQLAMTRRFIESSRDLHSKLVQSLEPPNYRYTTLEDTMEYISKRTPPKLTMEEALEEVQQEMRDRHHI